MAQTSTSSLVEEEAKKLIDKLTGFKDSSDENFRRSLQFALSNFKFHRYLDVDSHKITKKHQGLLQKFEIHSQLEKAESLRKLTDRFLKLPLSEQNKDGKTDIHYSVLSVLLNLSDCPVNGEYTETLRVPNQREGDDFDWGKYLQEGLAPVPSFRDSSSDEWSDEEVLDDSAIQADQTESSLAAPRHPIGAAISGRPLGSLGFGEEHHGRSWLERNIVVQYWVGDKDRTVQSSHSSASMASTWRAFEQHRDLFPSVEERYTLTEMHIIRETIWVLMGAEASFMYHLQGSTFTSRPDVQVSHLTPRALHKLTTGLAEMCTNARELQGFVDMVRATPMAYITTKDSSPERGQARCQTYESFAEALAVILWEFRQELTQWEKEIMKQEASVTLSQFAADLEPWAKRLSLLSRVHEEGIGKCEAGSCAQCTWLLLSALQGSIQSEYEQGLHKEQNVLLLLRVWIVTIRPYIHFLDNWLSGCPLYDPAQEFVIQRNPEITVKSPDFWEKAFTLHCFTPHNKHGTSRQHHSNVQQSGPDQSRQEGADPGRVAVPVFLQPVLGEILLAGKCMELLESMGQLPMVWRKYHPEESSVYDKFSSSVKRHLYGPKPDITDQEDVSSKTQPEVDEVAAIVSLTELHNLGIRDPLMVHNFRELFTELEYFSLERNAESESWSSLPDFGSPLTNNMKSLTLLLHRCLYPLLTAKCQAICKELVVTLKKDYHLMEMFASMRKFYLCEAGDTMFDFLSDLFDKLRSCHHESQWQDMLYLNYQLQTAINTRFPSDAERLTVSFEKVSVPSTVSTQPIHALDGLTLHYKVPWPLDIIINAECIAAYNQVFRFLLQVKRAKYCLEQLRFSSISHSTSPAESTEPGGKPRVGGAPSPSPQQPPLSRAQLLHRVYLLRFKLVHFVNAVHSYLMSRILHSTGLEFQSDIDKAGDLESIIEVHANYLSKVSERCLLHRKVGLVREAVTKALNLALVFQRRWDAGLIAFSAKSIEQMLSEFNKCSVFLLTMLNNINKRGAFPHLEALALSLTQSHGEESSTRPEENLQK